MATGFKIPDGRDLSDIFGSGSRGSAVGFQTSNGTDLGYQFASGSTGITTGMQNSAGIDLGSLFGPPGATCAVHDDHRLGSALRAGVPVTNSPMAPG